jgi:pantetheine-phosphate adenylyltransferase
MTARPRIAVCPGSFDPMTLGHADIVLRALRFADRVIVAVGHAPTETKTGMFSVEERLEMIRDVFAGEPRVEAAEFQGLLVEFARSREATIIVRGLRGVKDFEYEFQMALMNREMADQIETVFMAPAAELSFVSSTLVRQIASLGGDATPFVPGPIVERLKRRGAGGRGPG